MRVLLVEDDKEIQSSLKKSLETECFSVDAVSNGETGSYLGRTNDYDLIILDYVLPLKSGAEICQDIRSAGKSTPIIILTVQNEVNRKIDTLNMGADDYITKPFSFDELMARVRAILRRPAKIINEVMRIDDLEMDLNKHHIVRGGKEIYLTRKEYELLEYLMLNKGSVLSRGAIMEHVWDMNADPFSNTLETHILNLRRKIDLNGSLKLIHTLPGRGYKIDIKK